MILSILFGFFKITLNGSIQYFYIRIFKIKKSNWNKNKSNRTKFLFSSGSVLPTPSWEALIVLLEIYFEIWQKKSVFLGILKKFRQNHSGAPKGLPPLLVASHHQ